MERLELTVCPCIGANVVRLAEVAKKASLNFRFCQNITDTKTTLN
jgi:hypothetical protein